MTDTFRALFKEMVDWIDQETHTSRGEDPLVTRARALLAEPEPEGPTIGDVMQLWASTPHIDEAEGAIAFARAVLARWGRPAAAPVPEPVGEVEELLATAGVFKGSHGIEGLLNADAFWEQQPYGTRLYYGDGIADYLHRGVLRSAATLLQQQAAPVPVSERLPGLDVKCWWFDSTKQWYFRSWKEINIAGLRQPTHWLPFNALLLPQVAELEGVTSQ